MNKKVLFLPFLKITSGHHQAADALIEHIKVMDSSIHCEKVDILSYSYGKTEKVVSKFYLKWIHLLPFMYSWIYRKSCGNFERERRYFILEIIFLRFIQKLIHEKQPDYIFCTHALPSYLLSRIKERGIISIPVINVYTDFFINDIWGRRGIDYHFVPDFRMKEWLIQREIQKEQIIITGIPIHPELTGVHKKQMAHSSNLSILISGGSLGAGVIKPFIRNIGKSGKINYIVLCGKNKRLYKYLMDKKHPRIIPMAFIESREEMNRLYNCIDAVLTKPGGVTISECLSKQIPILVYHTLPGQEEINLERLLEQKLVLHLNDWKHTDIENQILTLWNDEQNLQSLKEKMGKYCKQATNFTLALSQVFQIDKDFV
ncbi:UDP-glucuronosyltransferase [Paenibacillus larvae]